MTREDSFDPIQQIGRAYFVLVVHNLGSNSDHWRHGYIRNYFIYEIYNDSQMEKHSSSRKVIKTMRKFGELEQGILYETDNY